jgi:hypothetical protein
VPTMFLAAMNVFIDLLSRSGLYDRFRGGPIEPLRNGFLFGIFPADTGPLFLGFAENVLFALHLPMHVLKNVGIGFVFHASVYACSTSYLPHDAKITL